ncbi:MAG: hypothetical protein ABIA04_06505 [Pseudomonadota bacterium]
MKALFFKLSIITALSVIFTSQFAFSQETQRSTKTCQKGIIVELIEAIGDNLIILGDEELPSIFVAVEIRKHDTETYGSDWIDSEAKVYKDRNGRILEEEIDFDGDGIVDRICGYEYSEDKTYSKTCGKIENDKVLSTHTVIYNENGNPIQEIKDLDNDGSNDVVIDYEYGVFGKNLKKATTKKYKDGKIVSQEASEYELVDGQEILKGSRTDEFSYSADGKLKEKRITFAERTGGVKKEVTEYYFQDGSLIRRDYTNYDDRGQVAGQEGFNSVQGQVIYEEPGKNITFSGQLDSSGLQQGHGTMKINGFDYYEGEFRDGKQHGKGVLKVKEFTYSGDFANGTYHGQGTLTYGDGRQYQGEFRDGRANGFGSATLVEGRKYKGQFKDDKPNGQGTITLNDGSQWTGTFVSGVPQGQGKVTEADGSQHTGDFDSELTRAVIGMVDSAIDYSPLGYVVDLQSN